MSRNSQLHSQTTADDPVAANPVKRYLAFLVLAFTIVISSGLSQAQTTGSSSITGTVTDPTGAVVPGATVEIRNPVSEYSRTATTDNLGKFAFPNVPVNPYHMTVKAQGFAPYVQDVDVRSAVPVSMKVALQISATAENVTVQGEAGDLLENDPTFHTDVDRQLFSKIPLESTSSELSSLVTLSSPGIAADSNGLFHGLGDHAENSFSLDGQPITDQQSKVFSNQIPLDAVQSMTVIGGAPSAEYGDKTSVIVDVTTRSGLGSTTPHGDVTASYGTFGSSNVDVDFSYGGKNWGNFIAVNGLNTGRFLDGPEFTVFHDHGNEENLFDRVDYVLSSKDALHFNFSFTRSWFQTPNSYDQEFHDINGTPDLNPLTGVPVGPDRSTLPDPDLQHCAYLDPHHQQQCRFQSHWLRAARRLSTTTPAMTPSTTLAHPTSRGKPSPSSARFSMAARLQVSATLRALTTGRPALCMSRPS